MIKVRRSTFETNSSSTHTITIVSKEEYEGWKNGTFLLDYYEDELIPVRELTDAERQEAIEDYEINKKSWYPAWGELEKYDKNQVFGAYSAKLMGDKRRYMTLKDWDERCNENGYDTTVARYTTKSGDQIVAFGYGGYNG